MKKARNSKAGIKITKPRRMLKISAIIILLCVIIIAAGIFREYAGHHRPTASQDQAAKDIVSAALKQKGEDISQYEFSVEHEVRADKRHNMTLIQAYLSSNATREMYLIDLNAQKIIVHAQVDFSSTDQRENNEYCEKFDFCHVMHLDK